MKRMFVMLITVCCTLMVAAQGWIGKNPNGQQPPAQQQVNPEDREVDMDNPTFVPTMKVGKALVDGDSILFMDLSNVYVYPPVELKTASQQKSYNRLVRNVKKVLPIAKEANQIIIETYEYLQTLPDKKSKDEHMKRVEDDIYKTYKPRMKKLTYSQGKLLIKLIYRECNSSSYDIVKAFMGPIRAGFWQAFAWAFGASLKKEYKPETTDRLTERVVLLVEAGQL
ncbi:MAG: DUF4294 domain-containing protein [Prevotella sp.]|nr:DUF4294 domain-containing protein [Prevotella sp.]